MLWVSLRLGRITRQAQCMVSSVTSPRQAIIITAANRCSVGELVVTLIPPAGATGWWHRASVDRVTLWLPLRVLPPLVSPQSAHGIETFRHSPSKWVVNKSISSLYTVTQCHSVTVSQCRVTLSKSLSALLAKLYICRASLSFSSAQCLLKAKNHFISLKPLQSPLNFNS